MVVHNNSGGNNDEPTPRETMKSGEKEPAGGDRGKTTRDRTDPNFRSNQKQRRRNETGSDEPRENDRCDLHAAEHA